MKSKPRKTSNLQEELEKKLAGRRQNQNEAVKSG